MSGEEQTKILKSAKAYFAELVDGAIESRRVATTPLISHYLVELLDFYLISENLHNQEDKTLAEAFLKATSTEDPIRKEKLKNLGDTSLYISGFFGDSLQSKVVDIDYYAEIGGSAYSSLAAGRQDLWTEVYDEFSKRFLEFVDVLTVVSQKALVQSNGDILRLYDRYLATGSKLAEDQLTTSGIISPNDLKKASDQ